jgi:hypothetical protein
MNSRASLAIQNTDLKAPSQYSRRRMLHGYVAPKIAFPTFKISRSLLLGLYSIIPIAVAVVLLDIFFFNGALKGKLPHSPDDLLVFAVFFNLPHIVASSLCFADVEYLKYYRLRIIAPILIVLGSLVFFPTLFLNPVFSAAVYLWTVIHVIGQQFGMIRLMGKNSSKLLGLWKWVAIALGAVVYFGTYVSGAQIGHTDEWVRKATLLGGWTLAVPFSWLAWKIYSKAESELGKRSVLGNFAMMLSVVVLYQLGYSFFLVLIPRVIHDLSAFIFYTAHDLNRNRFHTPNLVYRALRATGLPMRLLSPSIAIAIALPLTYYYHRDVIWAYKAAIALTLFHYYTDRFVWKNGSPLRQSISFH